MASGISVGDAMKHPSYHVLTAGDELLRIGHALHVLQGYERAMEGGGGLTRAELHNRYEKAQNLLAKHVGGNLELLRHLAQYTARLHFHYTRTDEDHPGVFDYEVSDIFGGCFAGEIIRDHFPDHKWCIATIDRLAADFYKEAQP